MKTIDKIVMTHHNDTKQKNFFEVDTVFVDGTKERKVFGKKDFVKAFNDAYGDYEFSQRKGQTKNMELTDTRFIAKSTTRKGFVTCFEVPKQKWFLIHGAKPVIVNLPKLIVKVDSSGNIWITTTNAKKVDASTELLEFNFPNMLMQNYVCFGGFKKRKLKSVDEVFDYFNSFFAGTPFTHSMPLNVKKNKQGVYVYKHVEQSVGTLQEFLKYKE